VHVMRASAKLADIIILTTETAARASAVSIALRFSLFPPIHAAGASLNRAGQRRDAALVLSSLFVERRGFYDIWRSVCRECT
jgi:hypothetical protein